MRGNGCESSKRCAADSGLATVRGYEMGSEETLFGKRLHPFSVRLQNGVTSQISTQTESPANLYPKKSQNKVLRIKESNS
jgi:CxxC motif-containing protein